MLRVSSSSRQGTVSTRRLTLYGIISFSNRVRPCVIRVKRVQSWPIYTRVHMYGVYVYGVSLCRRKTHEPCVHVYIYIYIYIYIYMYMCVCVSHFPSPCAHNNPLSSPSVMGIEINKQASGAISRSVNIYLTVSRLELPASGVSRHLRLNFRS